MASDELPPSLMPQSTQIPAGTQIIGTYEIEEHLNTGGMGEVYRGHNIHTGEPVAIKIVLSSLAHDPKIISLFQKEATVLNRLNHEAIVRYQIFTVDPGIQRPCLVMEFVGGESLADFIRKGPMATDQVFALLHRVASGLLAAHKLGVIHRDLSPDNVILQDGRVEHAKIIDFGIAKAANVGKGRTLIGDNFAGKFGYVAPEQLGKYGREVTERSDIYSLGLLAAAACRGEALDMGDDFYLALEARNAVPDLSGIEPEMRAVLERMLQPDPADRPADMAEVLALLPDPGEVTEPPQEAFRPPASAPPSSRPPAPKPGSQAPPGSQPLQGSVAPSEETSIAPPRQSEPPGSAPPEATSLAPPPAARGPVSTEPTSLSPPPGSRPPAPEPSASPEAPRRAPPGQATEVWTGSPDQRSQVPAAPAPQSAPSGSSPPGPAETTVYMRGAPEPSAVPTPPPGSQQPQGSQPPAPAARSSSPPAAVPGDSDSPFGPPPAVPPPAPPAPSAPPVAPAAQAAPAAAPVEPSAPPVPVAARKGGGGLMIGVAAVAVVAIIGAGAWFGGLIPHGGRTASNQTPGKPVTQPTPPTKLAKNPPQSVPTTTPKATPDPVKAAALAPKAPPLAAAVAAGTALRPPAVPAAASRPAASAVPLRLAALPAGRRPPVEATAKPRPSPRPQPKAQLAALAPAAPDPAARRTALLQAFDSGACAFAEPAGPGAPIVTYAAATTDVATLRWALARTEGPKAPTVAPRMVSAAQCPAVSLVAGLAAQGGTAAPITLTLDHANLKPGVVLHGTVSGAAGRPLVLYMVDSAGSLYDISSRLKPTTSGVDFALTLSPAAKVKATAGLPVLFLALASNARLTNVRVPAGTQAATLLPALSGEIAQRQLTADAALQFARFRFN